LKHRAFSISVYSHS